jgi:glycosyltransferase involved in cell wall biosynthesis
MTPIKRLVSIGVPVYNGAPFLTATLESLLAQTYTDIELIISDNGSCDETAAICRTYSARDPRIRYERQETNRGAAWNYNHVFTLASGQYFKWAADDDVIDPGFVARSVAVLDRDPSVVLCYFSTVVHIDDEGNTLTTESIPLVGDSLDRQARFRSLLRQFAFGCPLGAIFGMIRTSALRKTALIQNYYGCDRPLLVELGMHGRFCRIPDSWFYGRSHARRSTRRYPDAYSIAEWFVTGAGQRPTFPAWRALAAYLKIIARSEMGLVERYQSLVEVVKWVRWGHLGPLVSDLEHFLRGVTPRSAS